MFICDGVLGTLLSGYSDTAAEGTPVEDLMERGFHNLADHYIQRRILQSTDAQVLAQVY